MNDLLVRFLAVDFVIDLLVVVRRQRDADLLAPADDDRLRPDRVVQLQHRRFRPLRQGVLDGRPRHFQIGQSRQHLLTREIVEEELFARKRRAEALFAQIGGIAVQQGVKDGCRCTLFASWHIDPIALFGEGIRGQADPLRLGVAIKLIPIQFQTLDPQVHELREFPVGDPFVDRLLQVGIGAEQRERFLVASYLSLVSVFDGLFTIGIRLEFVGQLFDRAHHEAQPFVHRRSTRLQRVSDLEEISRPRFLTDEVQ